MLGDFDDNDGSDPDDGEDWKRVPPPESGRITKRPNPEKLAAAKMAFETRPSEDRGEVIEIHIPPGGDMGVSDLKIAAQVEGRSWRALYSALNGEMRKAVTAGRVIRAVLLCPDLYLWSVQAQTFDLSLDGTVAVVPRIFQSSLHVASIIFVTMAPNPPKSPDLTNLGNTPI